MIIRRLINFVETAGPRYTGSYAKEPPPANEPFRMVTWNIKFGAKVDSAIAELAHADALVAAAVLLLQEMDDAGVERIAQALDFNYVYYPASIHSRNGRFFGNAVLAKWPITRTIKLVLPHNSPTNRQRRIAVGAHLDLGEQQLAAYSVHTETPVLPPSKRSKQISHLGNQIANTKPAYTIIGGDFNTFTTRSIAALDKAMAAANLLPITKRREPTLKKGFLRFSLDHLYVDGLSPISVGVWSKTVASDHFPLWAVVRAQT